MRISISITVPVYILFAPAVAGYLVSYEAFANDPIIPDRYLYHSYDQYLSFCSNGGGIWCLEDGTAGSQSRDDAAVEIQNTGHSERTEAAILRAERTRRLRRAKQRRQEIYEQLDALQIETQEESQPHPRRQKLDGPSGLQTAMNRENNWLKPRNLEKPQSKKQRPLQKSKSLGSLAGSANSKPSSSPPPVSIQRSKSFGGVSEYGKTRLKPSARPTSLQRSKSLGSSYVSASSRVNLPPERKPLQRQKSAQLISSKESSSKTQYPSTLPIERVFSDYPRMTLQGRKGPVAGQRQNIVGYPSNRNQEKATTRPPSPLPVRHGFDVEAQTQTTPRQTQKQKTPYSKYFKKTATGLAIVGGGLTVYDGYKNNNLNEMGIGGLACVAGTISFFNKCVPLEKMKSVLGKQFGKGGS